VAGGAQVGHRAGVCQLGAKLVDLQCQLSDRCLIERDGLASIPVTSFILRFS
jgi:hypothetical protein